MKFPTPVRPIIAIFLLSASAASAGPNIPAGDLLLRHDLQRLADRGIIKGPVSTWPLAWGPIVEDISRVDSSRLPPAILSTLVRVRDRAYNETRTTVLTFNAKIGAAESATRIRSFQNTPRGKAEVSTGASWIDNWLSVELNVQATESDQDTEELRADDSLIGIVLGNWSVAATSQQRWWGPGWDGSLILSNNARPIPSLSIDRVFTSGFESKWLGWLGPWDLSLIFGQFERERQVPHAQFFGMRFNFKPVPSLEIGLSRTAQWCGDDRPCSFDTFVDLFVGRDNLGDAGIGAENEPGNQMAGVDFRWAPSFIKVPLAVYGQFIGEDEAGGLPSRYLVQAGLEGSGYIANKWSFRWFAEIAGTSCDFISNDLFNCAYTQAIYATGYRFRGRSLGHGADNDARLVSAGWMMVDESDSQWRALFRFGDINRGGAPDSRHSLTPTPQDVASVDLSYSREFSFGVIDVGAGYERIDDDASDSLSADGRFYIQWRSSY